MRVDLYTKVVLTGILGCLLWVCVAVAPIGTPVQAQLGPTQVVIAGYQAGGTTKALDGGLPVTIVQPGSDLGSPAPAVASPLPAAAAPSSARRAPERPAQASTRCQATTQKGTQCSRNAKPGSRTCWQHGG